MTTTITETQSQTATQSEPGPEPMGSESGTEVLDSQPLGEQQTTPVSYDTQSSDGVVNGYLVTPNTVATNLQGNLQQSPEEVPHPHVPPRPLQDLGHQVTLMST